MCYKSSDKVFVCRQLNLFCFCLLNLTQTIKCSRYEPLCQIESISFAWAIGGVF